MPSSRKTITFRLDVKDDWPPVAAECVPVGSAGGGFRLKAAPLFVKGLSNGDVIAITEEDQGQVWSWTHVSKSSHSTVWLAKLGKVDLKPLLAKLRKLGCVTISLEQFGLHSVDVPPSVKADALDKALSILNAKAAAVVFPSWRHEDNDA